MSFLEKIQTPADLKKLNDAELDALAREIREELIETVSKTGGHLASNLGVVELTLALHRVFDCPGDQIVFDVGHQAYVHKMLTGRRAQMNTIRMKDGLSGFASRRESDYDCFGGGHSGTSLSAAIGLAIANKLDGNDHTVVAVIGDGSFTNGMVYEALNNIAEHQDLRLVVVLNDNEMSISHNVGGLSAYLSDLRTSQGYFSFKHGLYHFLIRIPVVGSVIYRFAKWVKDVNKRIFFQRSFFEDLGLDYLGPIDGNNIKKMEIVLREMKRNAVPGIVHVCTRKGAGYPDAEAHPDFYHAVPPFDRRTGYRYDQNIPGFSEVFGKTLCRLAEKDDRICAVTAAMAHGTGLSDFAQQVPSRFFDVGIAEEHAVTFCAGLSANGKIPVFAVYSSFLQRSYDQLIHDIAIQQLPFVLCVDRAGFVPGDGITHQGIFDVSFLSDIPGWELYSPENDAELAQVLTDAVSACKPVAIRYPKGCQQDYDRSVFVEQDGFCYADYAKPNATGKQTVIITYGRVCANAVEAAKASEGPVRVIRLKRLKPIDYAKLFEEVGDPDRMILLEEGIRHGGICEQILAYMRLHALLPHCQVLVRAVEDRFVENGSVEQLMDLFGLSPEKIGKLLCADFVEELDAPEKATQQMVFQK